MSRASSPVIDALHELHALTSDHEGAQRVCWTETWARARQWMRDQLSQLPVVVELDEAGNQWATLSGKSPRALLIGGHRSVAPLDAPYHHAQGTRGIHQ